MIKEETIDAVFEYVRIEDVISDKITLKQKGSIQVGRCPFHDEKTPSFTVFPKTNTYKCFGCGKQGNSIGFLMELDHLEYPEAIRRIADKYNIAFLETDPDPKQQKKLKLKTDLVEFNKLVLKFYQSNLTPDINKKAHKYLTSRFSENAIKTWELGIAVEQTTTWTSLFDHCIQNGYKTKFLMTTGLFRQSANSGKVYDFFRDRIVFPIRDKSKNLISFTARKLPHAAENIAKFINLETTAAYDKSNVLYGMHEAINPMSVDKIAVLVEGNPDCIKMHEIGITNTVATSGTALTEQQIAQLKRFSDRIFLLYDGDKAGQKALLSNGMALVEAGLVPYALILPRKHDPDSFFKDKDHYNRWTKKYKKDFITWYSTNLLSKVDGDPFLKNKAVDDIAKILSNLPKSTRTAYIQTLSLQDKVITKLLNDRFKEIDMVKVVKEKSKEGDTPRGVDAKEYNTRGFYEYQNEYTFRTKSGQEVLSNFVMKAIFHIDSIQDSKRIYELTNKHGYKVVVNLDMAEMTSLQGFQRNVESKGNFMFWGQMQSFQKLKLKLYEETRTCVEIKDLGWQKEGFWAWSNGMQNGDGVFQPIDEYGVVTHDGQDYFIPAFSKIYIRDKSIFLDERKFQFKPSQISLDNWMPLYLKVHGDNAMMGFAFYLSALFRDHILAQNDNFPMLNLFGQKGSGKNTLAYSLLSLFGKKQTEYNIHNGTKPGLAKHLEMFRNGIAFLDEYKNNLDFDKIETIKSIYNSIGRSRLNMDKGGKKETTEVNQAVIVAGQEMPTIDVALSTRMIFLQFLTKEGLSQEQKKDFEKLQEIERNGLSHFSAMFLKHRVHMVEYYKENYDKVMRDLMTHLEDEDINDRLLRNACAVMATFKTLEPKFNFAFSYKQLLKSAVDITRAHNAQIKQSDEIGVFWTLMEALFDDNHLIDKWHFRVRSLDKLKTLKQIHSFTPAKNILKFKFNSVAKLYAEHLKRSGIKPLPQDSLQHYLQTSKYFIGIEKSCKFTRKDFIAGESKAQVSSQTTSAFCFDYDMLKINLIRDQSDAFDSDKKDNEKF